MISQKAKYALRALVALAKQPPGTPTFIGDIAESQSIPKKFLEQILLDTMYELPTLENVSKVVVDESIRLALENRPELEQQRLLLQTREVEVSFNRNQALPRVDLRGTVKFAGAAGRGEIVDPLTGQTISLDTNLGDALEQVIKRDFPTYTLGVSVSMPFQNRAARANLTLARLELEKARYQMRDLESLVTTEVRTAARAVDSAAKVVEAAKASRRLQEKNLDAERKRYENGMSTSFQVLQIQEDVTSARSNLVRALSNYRRAIVGYYAAVGQLLTHNGVEIAETAN